MQKWPLCVGVGREVVCFYELCCSPLPHSVFEHKKTLEAQRHGGLAAAPGMLPAFCPSAMCECSGMGREEPRDLQCFRCGSAPAGIPVTGRSGEEFRHHCLSSRCASEGPFSTSSHCARSAASMLKAGWNPEVCPSVAPGCCGSSAIGDSVCAAVSYSC